MGSIEYNKAYKFAMKIVNLYRYLCFEKKDYVISKQILRSGTSIGANIKEGLYAQSRKDFLSKINIALKEAAETEYWVQLLIYTNNIDKEIGTILLKECRELISMLASTVKTTKKNS